MAAEWYLKIADKESNPPIWSTVGPLSAQELRAKAGKGQIGPEDLVRQGNEGSWVPATRVKGLLGAGASAGQPASEAIPVAKLLKPADEKSSKAKSPSTSAPARKKKSDRGKTAKAIEEPATEMNLPPVVAKGSVLPPVPPSPPVPASAAPAPAVTGVEAADVAAANPPAVSATEAEPPAVPHGRHSPGIELPFDVSPTASSGSHARVAVAEKTSAAGSAKAPAAKEKPKFQINYTIVAVAVVVVISAGLFIFVSMSGNDSKDKGKKAAAAVPAEKPPEETKESPVSPDGPKKPAERKPETTDDLNDLLLKGGKVVGPSKPATPSTKPQEKNPDNAAKDKWFDASKEPAVGKNVSIAVKSAKLGKFLRVGKNKFHDGVKLTLQVTNTVNERRLKCQWEALNQVPPDSMLVDSFEHPNGYALKKTVPKSEEPIDPGDSMEVDLIFEKPIMKAKYLHLKLPGAIFNEPDPVQIQVPIDMIQPADEHGDENPAPANQGPPDPNKLPPVPTDQPAKPIPGVNGPNAPEVPDLGLPAPPADSSWQPRGNRGVELADAEPRRPAAVSERRITDFDDDPAMVERFGQPLRTSDPDRRGSRRAVQR